MNKEEAIKEFKLKDEKEFKGKEPEVFISREQIIKMYNQLKEDDKAHSEEHLIKGFVYYLEEK